MEKTCPVMEEQGMIRDVKKVCIASFENKKQIGWGNGGWRDE